MLFASTPASMGLYMRGWALRYFALFLEWGQEQHLTSTYNNIVFRDLVGLHKPKFLTILVEMLCTIELFLTLNHLSSASVKIQTCSFFFFF